MTNLTTFLLLAPSVIIAITFHEVAHGYVAYRLGDNTAFDRGRLTLNPLKHVDLFGTILLPALLLLSQAGVVFGFAKPVPVNPKAFLHPRRDMAWVAVAGPATNLLLAAVSFLFLIPATLMTGHIGDLIVTALTGSIFINVGLALFNLIPIPPLDGSKVAAYFLPPVLRRPYDRMQRYGMLILIVVVLVLPKLGDRFGLDLNIFDWTVRPALMAVHHMLGAMI